jgi:hypothetical protein
VKLPDELRKLPGYAIAGVVAFIIAVNGTAVGGVIDNHIRLPVWLVLIILALVGIVVGVLVYSRHGDQEEVTKLKGALEHAEKRAERAEDAARMAAAQAPPQPNARAQGLLREIDSLLDEVATRIRPYAASANVEATPQEMLRARYIRRHAESLMDPMPGALSHLLSNLLPNTPPILLVDEVGSALNQMKQSVTTWGLAHPDPGS